MFRQVAPVWHAQHCRFCLACADKAALQEGEQRGEEESEESEEDPQLQEQAQPHVLHVYSPAADMLQL